MLGWIPWHVCLIKNLFFKRRLKGNNSILKELNQPNILFPIRIQVPWIVIDLIDSGVVVYLHFMGIAQDSANLRSGEVSFDGVPECFFALGPDSFAAWVVISFLILLKNDSFSLVSFVMASLVDADFASLADWEASLASFLTAVFSDSKLDNLFSKPLTLSRMRSSFSDSSALVTWLSASRVIGRNYMRKTNDFMKDYLHHSLTGGKLYLEIGRVLAFSFFEWIFKKPYILSLLRRLWLNILLIRRMSTYHKIFKDRRMLFLGSAKHLLECFN